MWEFVNESIRSSTLVPEKLIVHIDDWTGNNDSSQNEQTRVYRADSRRMQISIGMRKESKTVWTSGLSYLIPTTELWKQIVGTWVTFPLGSWHLMTPWQLDDNWIVQHDREPRLAAIEKTERTDICFLFAH